MDKENPYKSPDSIREPDPSVTAYGPNVVGIEYSSDEFERIRDTLLSDKTLPDGISLADIKQLHLFSPVAGEVPKGAYLKDRAALLGCGIVGFIFLFLVMMGIGAAVGLFSQ